MMRLSIPMTIAGVATVILIAIAISFMGGCSLMLANQIPANATITGLPPTPTSRILNAIEMAADNQIHVAETQQVEELIAKRVNERATATAAGTATAIVATEQARADATQARINQATAQAQARYDAATAQAHADSLTQQAVSMAATQYVWGVTVTAAVIGTQTAFPMTQTAMPMYATAEAASLLAKGTEERGNADLTYLTVQRQSMKNGLDAYLPWTLIVSGFIIGVLAIVVYSQFRQLKRDRNGLLGVEVVKHKNGVTYVKSDQMTGPAMTVNKHGQITEVGSDSEFQQNTTRRQQLREATIGKTIPEFKQVVGMFGAPGGNSGGVNYFDADRRFGKILGEAEEDMVDGEVTDV
jgi:hypothetical protein